MSDVQETGIRTDLAVEAKDMYVQREKKEADIPGVSVQEEKLHNIKVTTITISEAGEKAIQKKAGNYVTIFTEGIVEQDTKLQSETAEAVATQINVMLKKNKVKQDSKGLVVGLGNWNVTPDALGPMTVDKVLVTNHLFELNYESVHKGYRPIAAISPGVMGTTGMETSDIVLSVISKFKPEFVLVIDALASRAIERINTTIQITDTGIHPGSGVGNHRKELSKEILGIPVIAIGVPTVVDLVTIASDTMQYVLQHFGREWKETSSPRRALLTAKTESIHDDLSDDDLPDEEKRSMFFGLIGCLSEDEKRHLLNDILTPTGKNLIVTPKEVDAYLHDMAHVIAQGINAAFHENVQTKNDAHFTR